MTRPSKRARTLEGVMDDLTTAGVNLDPAVARMMDARPGLPGGQSFDPTSRSTGGLTQPERHAKTSAERADPATVAIKELDHSLRQLQIHAAIVARHVRANTPKAPTDKQRAEVEAANVQPEQLCQHCTPWVHSLGVETVHRSGDVNGNLPAPLSLGRWCYDFVRAHGRLPSRQEVERHDNGQPVRVSA